MVTGAHNEHQPATPTEPSLDDWVGRTADADDRVALGAATRLAATLGVRPPVTRVTDPLPPLWHWLAFMPSDDRAVLGHDGHVHDGRFLPSPIGKRRVFGAGTLRVLEPVVPERSYHRRSRVTAVSIRQGSSGPLIIITIEHTLSDDGRPVLDETNQILYIDANTPPRLPDPDRSQPPPPDPVRIVTPDEIMLFRFSALTFNSHRIHYDRTYATEVEGYPDLVVQGPLTAVLLAIVASETLGQVLTAFQFRAVAPLFVNRPISLHVTRTTAGGTALEARDWNGVIAMVATAESDRHAAQ